MILHATFSDCVAVDVTCSVSIAHATALAKQQEDSDSVLCIRKFSEPFQKSALPINTQLSGPVKPAFGPLKSLRATLSSSKSRFMYPAFR